MSLSSTLRRAIRARGGRPQDAAAEALALTYAQLIDNAAPAARYRKHLRALAAAVDRYRGEDEDDVRDAFEALSVALGAHTVASDLGPKLLATLGQLGMANRDAGEDPNRGQQQQPTSPLDELKQRRQQRAAGAPAR